MIPIYDTTFQTLDLQVAQTDSALQLIIAVGSVIPTPQGPAPLPAGVHRYHVSKEVALNYAQQIITAAEQLPDTPKPSDLIIAGNLGDVDKAAQDISRVTGV